MTENQRNGGALWEAEDVAAFLGLAPSTVRRWAYERRLPVVKVGGLLRFREADIKAWVEAQVQPATQGGDV